jgi:histidyl-tRNA synthetase
VKGGRYDKLLSHFGKDAAAIGFAIVVDQLMAALSRQDIDVPVIENSSLIVFDASTSDLSNFFVYSKTALSRFSFTLFIISFTVLSYSV